MTQTSLVRRIPRTPSVLSTAPFFRSLDHFFSEDFFRPLGLINRLAGEDLSAGWAPAVDVHESEEAYVFSAELPGLDKDDVSITLEKNVLTISGERKFEDEADRDNFRRIERAYGNFSRSFTLPSQVEQNKVSAEFKNGLMKITVPKAEQAKPRKIDIK